MVEGGNERDLDIRIGIGTGKDIKMMRRKMRDTRDTQDIRSAMAVTCGSGT